MKRVRIRFKLDEGQWHGSSTETLWAQACNDGLRKIDNIPFLAFDVSIDDTVKTAKNTDGIEDFVSVCKRGGNSTYRLIVKDINLVKDELSAISHLGCLYEVGEFGSVVLVAVSVPPEVDINEVYLILERAEKGGLWDFEESNFEHTV